MGSRSAEKAGRVRVREKKMIEVKNRMVRIEGDLNGNLNELKHIVIGIKVCLEEIFREEAAREIILNVVNEGLETSDADIEELRLKKNRGQA